MFSRVASLAALGAAFVGLAAAQTDSAHQMQIFSPGPNDWWGKPWLAVLVDDGLLIPQLVLCRVFR